ncbi:M24 family metallopeptidase [Falsiroseomonas sp.]|uniref:M24 family metallopeptidase n=1 Tax=Falsiroseomonas sp. TaxID=2870721 RepID=UPI003F71696E
MAGHIDRARAARLMQAAGLDALVLAAPESFGWATGAPAGVAANWRRLGAAIAVVPADPARPVGAVVSDLFAGAAEAAGCAPLHRHVTWPETADLRPFLGTAEDAATLVARANAQRAAHFARPATFDRAAGLAALRALLSDQGFASARLGVELSAVPAADLPALEAAIAPASMTDASPLVERLRAHKSPAEIALLREAGLITETALLSLLPEIRQGTTREALGQRFLELVRLVAQRRGTPAVTAWEYVGFGASPWSSPGGIARGDVVKVDVGAVVGGYSADLARTFACGPPPPAAREIHAALRHAFEIGRALFRPGAALRDIHAACLGAMHRAGFPSYARGHFGHGLGASIWSEEFPYTAADSEVVLEPGMVMAFELPWYLDGLGGFIVEDMLLVTEEGAETLAGGGLPHALVELP